MALEEFAAGCTHLNFRGNEYGTSKDGVDINVDPKWFDIPGDCGGGVGGVPINAQLLGATVRVVAEFTSMEINRVLTAPSFNPAHPPLAAGVGSINMPRIGSFVKGGVNPLGGELQLQGQNARLILPFAFFRHPQDFNLGSKSTFYSVGWECWLNDFQARQLMNWQPPL